MTEKRRPTYDLAAFKRAFSSVGQLYATTTALNSAAKLGFDRQGMIDIIQRMQHDIFTNR